MNAPLDSKFATLTTGEVVAYIDKLDRLFETERTWCKKYGAIDSEGNRLSDCCDSRAQSWCLIGGSWMVTNQPKQHLHTQAHLEVMMSFRRALDTRGVQSLLSVVNDGCTFEEMKALIAEARAVAPEGRIDLDIPSQAAV